MRLTIRLAALFCLASALGFAENWSGVLVDSKCYAAEERNVNPSDTEIWVDRDRGFELRYCHPKAHTKSFAIVQENGISLKLDSAGDAKAAEIVRTSHQKQDLFVAVTGEEDRNTVLVRSISKIR